MTAGVATLLRFWLGVGGAVAAGWLVFRGSVFQPSSPAFQCAAVGGLLAGALALVRARALPHALALVPAFGLFRFVGAGFDDAPAAAAGLLIGLGAVLVAWVFDRLARRGLRFGKFLVSAPLLGGVLFAVAPLTAAAEAEAGLAARLLLAQFVLGALIGGGAGLGVELADSLGVRESEGPGDPPGDEAAVPPARYDAASPRGE